MYCSTFWNCPEDREREGEIATRILKYDEDGEFSMNQLFLVTFQQYFVSFRLPPRSDGPFIYIRQNISSELTLERLMMEPWCATYFVMLAFRVHAQAELGNNSSSLSDTVRELSPRAIFRSYFYS